MPTSTLTLKGRFGFKNNSPAKALQMSPPELAWTDEGKNVLSVEQDLEGDLGTLETVLAKIAEMARWGSVWLAVGDARVGIHAGGWQTEHPAALPEGAEARWGRSEFGHDDGVGAMAFHPDGVRVATADCTNWSVKIGIWKAETGELLHRMFARDGDSYDNQEGMGLAWTPDGACLIAGGKDKGVRIWDAETGELLRKLQSPGIVRDIAVSSDGLRLVAGYSPGGFKRGGAGIRIWDLNTLKALHTIDLNRAPISVCIDGKRVVATFFGHSAEVFELESGQHVGSLGSDVRHAGPLPGGGVLTLTRKESSRFDASIFDADHGRVRTLETFTDGAANGWAASPDGKWLVSGGDAEIRVWDAESGALSHSVPMAKAYEIVSMAFEPGQSDRVWLGRGTGPVSIPIDAREVSTPTNVGALAVSGDGSRVATVVDGVLKVTSPDGEVVAEIAPEKASFDLVALSQAGDAVAYVNQMVLYVHNLLTGKPHAEYKLRDHIYSLDFLGDGTSVAYQTYKGVSLRSLETGKARSLSKCDKVFLDATSTRAALVKSDVVEFVTLAARRKTHLKLPYEGDLDALAFGVDCVFASIGNKLQCIDIESGETRWTVDGWTGALSASRDGALLASAQAERVRLFDVGTGALKKTLRGHGGRVDRLAFLPDGRLISASTDHSAVLWAPLAEPTPKPVLPAVFGERKAPAPPAKKPRAKKVQPLFKDGELWTPRETVPFRVGPLGEPIPDDRSERRLRVWGTLHFLDEARLERGLESLDERVLKSQLSSEDFERGDRSVSIDLEKVLDTDVPDVAEGLRQLARYAFIGELWCQVGRSALATGFHLDEHRLVAAPHGVVQAYANGVDNQYNNGAVRYEDATWRWSYVEDAMDGAYLLVCEDLGLGTVATRPVGGQYGEADVIVAPDGLMAMTVHDGKIQLLDTQLNVLSEPRKYQSMEAAWLSYGASLAAVSFRYRGWEDGSDMGLVFFDAATGEQVHRVKDARDDAGGFVDEARFATVAEGSKDSRFLMIDARAGKNKKLAIAEWRDEAIAMPGEETFALRSGGKVSIWALSTCKEVETFELEAYSDGDLTWDRDESHWAWRHRRWQRDGRSVDDFKYLRDGALGQTLWAGIEDGHVIVRNWRSGAVLHRGVLEGFYDDKTLVFSPDESVLIMLTKGKLHVLDVATGQWRATRKSIKAKLMVPAKAGLWVWFQDGKLQRRPWDDLAAVSVEFDLGFKGFRYATIDLAETHAVVSATDGQAHVMSLDDGSILGAFSINKREAGILAMASPDRMVVARGNSTILVDGKGAPLKQLEDRVAQSVCALPGERFVLGSGATASVFDAQSGARLGPLEMSGGGEYVRLFPNMDGSHVMVIGSHEAQIWSTDALPK